MKWYDGYETLSHNCLFNFIIGPRGVGKTYWSKRYQVKNFLKNKSQFIYVRRYKEELKKMDNYFNAIKKEFPEVEFSVKGTTLLINGEVAGWGMALSTSESLKSTEYPDVTSIVFEEFLIETGSHRYLPNEVAKFLGLYETVARLRENVIVFFLANATTMTNPYFMYFNVKIPYGSQFYKKGDVLFQYVDNELYKEEKLKTRFGKIIEGTDYAGYTVDNKFLLDNTSFIERKTGRAEFMFSMKYNTYLLGVWVDYKEGKMWVSYDVADTRMEFALTLADHSENTMLLKALSKSRIFKTFVTTYEVGRVFFEDMNIKNITYEIIKTTFR